MKNQRGITLMILVSTVVILALIAGTISYNSFSSYKMRVFYNMRSDIELLDEKIALYYLENGTIPTTADSKSINTLISGYGAGNVNYNPNNSGTLKKIDLNELDNLSLNYTNYYIDEISHTIYMGKGVTVGDETYYTSPYKYSKID